MLAEVVSWLQQAVDWMFRGAGPLIFTIGLGLAAVAAHFGHMEWRTVGKGLVTTVAFFSAALFVTWASRFAG